MFFPADKAQKGRVTWECGSTSRTPEPQSWERARGVAIRGDRSSACCPGRPVVSRSVKGPAGPARCVALSAHAVLGLLTHVLSGPLKKVHGGGFARPESGGAPSAPPALPELCQSRGAPSGCLRQAGMRMASHGRTGGSRLEPLPREHLARPRKFWPGLKCTRTSMSAGWAACLLPQDQASMAEGGGWGQGGRNAAACQGPTGASLTHLWAGVVATEAVNPP